MNIEPDWTLWRSFVAVVDHGSLSAAARHLGISQPTIGRHVETLESDLATPLFDRTLGGFKPNGIALDLYEKVNGAKQLLAEALLQVAGTRSDLSGTVRITASRVISHYVLPTLLMPVRERYPAVALEIVPSDASENLLLREADIAVRMFRPTQLDLITRYLGDIALVPIAHRSYLDRRGTPQTVADLAHHDLLGFDSSDVIIAHARRLGVALTRENFVFRTDDQPLLWELIARGHGIGFGQRNLIARTAGVEEIAIDAAVPPLPVWLTTHRELFTSRSIRAVYDALAEGLEAYINASSA